MPQLSNVAGNIDLTGNFEKVELPVLSTIGGGVNIESSSSSFQCPSNIRGATKGSIFNCKGDVQHPAAGQGLQYSNRQLSSAIKKELKRNHLPQI